MEIFLQGAVLYRKSLQNPISITTTRGAPRPDGLGVYNYGARFYNFADGSWWQIYTLAEKMRRQNVASTNETICLKG